MRVGAMRRDFHSRLWHMTVLGVLLTATSTLAQQPSREREALRRAQQQVAKLQQENAALQRDKTETDARLKAAETEAAKAKTQVSRLRKTAGALEAAEKENTDLKARLATSEERLRETAQKAQEQIAAQRHELASTHGLLAETRTQREQEVGKLQALLTGESARANACEEKNAQLYSVTMDLVAKYKANRGAWEKFLLSEPFTGLKSVQVENLLEDFRQRAGDASVMPR